MKKKNNSVKKEKNIYFPTPLMTHIITGFLLILVTVFPLIMTDGYFNITITKYRTFYISVIAMATITGVMTIDFWLNNFEKVKIKQNATNYFKSRENVFLILFLVACALSTLFSKFFTQSIYGEGSRYIGLFLMFVYCVLVFVVTQCWNFNSVVIKVLLCTSILMMILGITDFLKLDLLKIHEPLIYYEREAFMSTIGNTNAYSAFLAVIVGLCGTLFVIEKKNNLTVFYGVTSMITFLSLVACNTDNALLSLGTFFVVLPFVIYKNKISVMRYMILIAMFLFSTRIVGYLFNSESIETIRMNTVFTMFFTSNILIFIAVVLIALALIYYKFGSEKIGLILIKIEIVLLAVAILAITFLLIDVNALGNTERYGSLSSVLLLNDHWGGDRGIIWESTFDVFVNSSLKDKLIGSGTGTFDIVIKNSEAWLYFNEQGTNLDNAHNEYFNYLITIGLVGLVAYIGLILTSCVKMFKANSTNIYAKACFIAVICYCAQAMVNISVPVSTPFLWIVLGIGLSACKTKSEVVT